VAWTIIQRKLDGAINITASHNPGEYSGLKFSTSDISEGGDFLYPNELIALLVDYLVESRGWKGGGARTVATSHLVDRSRNFTASSFSKLPSDSSTSANT